MKISLFSSIYLLGILLALFLILGIRKKGSITKSANLLTFLLTAISLTLLHYIVFSNNWARNLPIIMGLETAAWFSIPPLLYLYIQSLLSSDFKFKAFHILFFLIPIYNVVQWFLHMMGIYYGAYRLFDSQTAYLFWWLTNYIACGLVFISAAIWQIRRTQLSQKQSQKIKWIIQYLYAFWIVLFLSFATLVFINQAEIYSSTFEYLLLFFFEVFVLIFVVKMIRSSNYFSELTNDTYRNSAVDMSSQEKIYQELHTFMLEQKPYLNKKLSLPLLAEQSQIPENKLSQLFSQHLDTSFYDFINKYRLEELERLILNPEKKQFKITAIAEESGFNSKATFYKYFKEKHGITPMEFIKRHQK